MLVFIVGFALFFVGLFIGTFTCKLSDEKIIRVSERDECIKEITEKLVDDGSIKEKCIELLLERYKKL